MTDLEIFLDLKEKTKEVKIKPRNKVKDINELCRYLILAQVSDNVLNEISFLAREEEFASLFEGFSPRGIVGHGKYTAQLKLVSEHFQPERLSPYKDFTQAVYLTAKYLSKFATLEDFEKQVYLACVDEESTLKYLEGFRSECGLSSMYFTKTCLFFAKTGLLDVPVPTKRAKAYLLPLMEIEDENALVYKRMYGLAKHNHISCYELNVRMENI